MVALQGQVALPDVDHTLRRVGASQLAHIVLDESADLLQRRLAQEAQQLVEAAAQRDRRAQPALRIDVPGAIEIGAAQRAVRAHPALEADGLASGVRLGPLRGWRSAAGGRG